MVTANELRIGNILERIEISFRPSENEHEVYADLDEYILTVQSIEETAVTLVNGLALDRFSGILLTEEWLLKFGMEKRTNYFEFPFIDAHLDYKVSEQYLLFNRYFSPVIDNPFKYVHQLQNAYFALTGEELTLKHENSLLQ